METSPCPALPTPTEIATGETETGGNHKRDDKVKRRFPGPAGILPKLKSLDQLDLVDESSIKRKKLGSEQPVRDGDGTISSKVLTDTVQNMRQPPSSTQTQTQSLSQESVTQESTWQALLIHLDLDRSDSSSSLMKLMNINWISKRAAKYQLPACIRVPFLIVRIQETNEFIGKPGFVKTGNPNVTLRDLTGSIEAAFDPKLLEEYSQELSVGTSLALKNVSLLQYKRSAALIITKCNIISIASKPLDDIIPNPDDESKELDIGNNVRITDLSNFNKDEILNQLQLINQSDLNYFEHSQYEQNSNGKYSEQGEPNSNAKDLEQDIDSNFSFTAIPELSHAELSFGEDEDDDDLIFSQIIEDAECESSGGATQEIISTQHLNYEFPQEEDDDDDDLLLSQVDEISSSQPPKAVCGSPDESFPDEDDDEFFNLLQGIEPSNN